MAVCVRPSCSLGLSDRSDRCGRDTLINILFCREWRAHRLGPARRSPGCPGGPFPSRICVDALGVGWGVGVWPARGLCRPGGGVVPAAVGAGRAGPAGACGGGCRQRRLAALGLVACSCPTRTIRRAGSCRPGGDAEGGNRMSAQRSLRENGERRWFAWAPGGGFCSLWAWRRWPRADPTQPRWEVSRPTPRHRVRRLTSTRSRCGDLGRSRPLVKSPAQSCN